MQSTPTNPPARQAEGKTEVELRREASELQKLVEKTYRMLQDTQPSRPARATGK